MTLKPEEIVAGAIAYLDGDRLLESLSLDPDKFGKQGMNRPFLCIGADANRSAWVALSSQHKPIRLNLNRWKVGGSIRFLATDLFVYDARKVISGLNSVFIAASRFEANHAPHKRPSITEEGIAAVLSEIGKYQAA